MKKFLLAPFLLAGIIAVAQDQSIKNMQAEASKTITKDTTGQTDKNWNTGGILSLTVAQGSLSNWAAGGEKFSLSFNSFINGHAYYKKGKNSWDNNLDLNIGYNKTTSLGTRKSDDRIELTSKYGRAINSKLNFAVLGNFRSQFFKGYDYPDANTKVYKSKFFAPAYVLLSPGLDYKPASNFSIFVSPATARWVIVSDELLRPLYGVDPAKGADFQFGGFASITYNTNLNSAISYSGKLDLFSNYLHNPQNVDLYMTNMFAVKLSKVLSATWNFNLIYDDDVKQFGDNQDAPALQLQSLVGAGLLYKF